MVKGLQSSSVHGRGPGRASRLSGDRGRRHNDRSGTGRRRSRVRRRRSRAGHRRSGTGPWDRRRSTGRRYSRGNRPGSRRSRRGHRLRGAGRLRLAGLIRSGGRRRGRSLCGRGRSPGFRVSPTTAGNDEQKRQRRCKGREGNGRETTGFGRERWKDAYETPCKTLMSGRCYRSNEDADVGARASSKNESIDGAVNTSSNVHQHHPRFIHRLQTPCARPSLPQATSPSTPNARTRHSAPPASAGYSPRQPGLPWAPIPDTQPRDLPPASGSSPSTQQSRRRRHPLPSPAPGPPDHQPPPESGLVPDSSSFSRAARSRESHSGKPDGATRPMTHGLTRLTCLRSSPLP